jgi:trehalose 6-phosphate phosphatase
MKYLMDFLDEIKNKINGQKRVLLLDYDGTLTPIVNTPEEAVLSKEMRSTLESQKDNPDSIVAIISGRSLLDVKSMVLLDGICYAGNHGMEIEYQNELYVHPDAKKMKHLIKKICKELEPMLEGIEGKIIEDKGLTASVHYRMVSSEEIPEVKRIVKSTIQPYIEKGNIKLTHGKMVLEIRPNIPWDKGKAVEWVLKSIGADISNKYFPIYIGDDRTDEDAFKIMKGRGLSVLVSSEVKDTNAEYALHNVDEVRDFLSWLSGINKNIVVD